MSQQVSNDFFIWGIDDTPYGPVELPVLVNWVKDERVLADTWIFVRRTGNWHQAADLPELKIFFRPQSDMSPTVRNGTGLTIGALRRIKILAELTDAQLEQLSQYLEPQPAPQWSVVVRRGD